ncbi:MAG TPA: tyrosine/phenylalanine carboxypeptidase domain-containing protein [Acidimicrobiales bacterium]
MPPALAPEELAVDRELADIAGRIDLLLDVTPVNATAAWDVSVAARHRAELDLRYRPRLTDVDAVLARLDRVPVAEVGNQSLRRLLTDTRDGLALQARLIAARGTPAFLDLSHALYGTAEPPLVALAEDLLARLPPPGADPPGVLVSPEDFARRARDEIARYRVQDPTFQGTVTVRGDVPSLMVVQRELLVGSDSVVPAHRQEALVHHEVGTHLLTAVAGGRQPLRLLEQGLAGFEQTQEALGVLSEHLVGGLDADRLRTVAARAVAARRLSDGARFPDLFAELHGTHGFGERAAWTLAMRIVRGGGFTKDVIYLRGLVEVVEHLGHGGALEPLLVGKLDLRHLAAVEALLGEGTLVPAPVRPHWLDGDAPARRLAALRAGTAPIATWL